MKPQYREIEYIDPYIAFTPFAHETGSILIDCPDVPQNSRYGYIAVRPSKIITAKNGYIQDGNSQIPGNPFQTLNQALKSYTCETISELPPFQGGLAGFLSYDMCHYLEKLPHPKQDDIEFPDLAMGIYDVVLAFDRLKQKAWVIVNGYPNGNYASAWQKAKSITANLGTQSQSLPNLTTTAQLVGNFYNQSSYEQTISKVIQYILDGDIFEANLTRRLKALLPDGLNEFQLYGLLRKINPAPFACYMNFDNATIASSSPERFIKLSNGLVETYPIKGTRPRGKTLAEDQLLKQELLSSEKDKAENLMIVDLMRNDLSRVCQPGTVKTPEICQLYSFATVHHLISKVVGKLDDKIGPIELLEATFPGGSITGAPKIRAMEIIAELEPTKRGPYCGSAGFIGFDGSMDTNILIRTFAIRNNTVTFQAGGAIVMDSNPTNEYEETNHKFSALKQAIGT